MANYEMKDGQFSLFKNKHKQEGDNKPDMTGKCMIGGKMYDLSAWTKTPEGKDRFLSGQIKTEYVKPQQEDNDAKMNQAKDEDDGLPF